MGWVAVTVTADADLCSAIEGKPDEWKALAISGCTLRELQGDDPRTFDLVKHRALSGLLLPSQREAWLFGWEWPDYALTRARSVICDLLQGRVLRMHAEDMLQSALWCEQVGAPREVVVKELERAAHWEWIAMISEQGRVMWGGRLNRCGRPEVVDDGED